MRQAWRQPIRRSRPQLFWTGMEGCLRQRVSDWREKSQWYCSLTIIPDLSLQGVHICYFRINHCDSNGLTYSFLHTSLFSLIPSRTLTILTMLTILYSLFTILTISTIVTVCFTVTILFHSHHPPHTYYSACPYIFTIPTIFTILTILTVPKQSYLGPACPLQLTREM
jgi:hypothetical protein